jgi:hypothetical protein
MKELLERFFLQCTGSSLFLWRVFLLIAAAGGSRERCLSLKSKPIPNLPRVSKLTHQMLPAFFKDWNS